MEELILLAIIKLSLLIISKSQHCTKSNNAITNTDCFNNIKIFEMDGKYYRSGHFAINTKGDLIIEYSYEQFRLFYGLKKIGNYFFLMKQKK